MRVAAVLRDELIQQFKDGLYFIGIEFFVVDYLEAFDVLPQLHESNVLISVEFELADMFFKPADFLLFDLFCLAGEEKEKGLVALQVAGVIQHQLMQHLKAQVLHQLALAPLLSPLLNLGCCFGVGVQHLSARQTLHELVCNCEEVFNRLHLLQHLCTV